MATGAEIAKAYVTLYTQMPGVKRDIERQLGAVDGSKQGRSLGQRFGNALASAAKIGALAAGAAVATIGVAGFRAAVGIETSQRVLGGLYGDAEQAKNVLQQLRDVGRDSPIDYAAYTQAAETLAYAGIEGENAVGVLENVGMAITAAGGDSDNMQRAMAGVMQAVNNGGIAMMDSLNRISEAGVPILSGLGEHFGVTIDEVRRMASAGEVNITDVMSVLQNATGDTFDQMITAGEAAQESFGNTWAAVKDNVITTVGEAMVPLIEKLTPIIKTAGDALADFIDGMVKGEGPGGRFVEIVQDLWDKTSTFVAGVVEVVTGVRDWVSANQDWLSALGVAAGVIAGVVIAVRTFRAVQLGLTAATYGVQGAMLVAGGSAKVYGTMMTLQAAKTKIVTVAQRAFNLAMSANPIGIVVTAVAALVAGLIWFFTQTETGQAIWESFTQFLSEAWDNISAFFVNAWENYIKPVFDGIAAVAIWVWETILQPVFNGMQVGFAILAGIIAGVWSAIIKPVFDAIGAVFKWIYDKIITPIILGIQVYIKMWGAVISWLWDKAIKPVFDAIGKIFKWAWNTIIKPIVDSVKKSIDLLGKVFTWLWDKAIKPSLDNVGNIFRWLKNTIIDPIWNGIKNTISNVWTNGIKPIIDRLVKVVKDDPKRAFEAARDGITSAWKKIQDAAKKPVKFVIDTVINGLIGTINKIPGVNIPKVPLPRGFHDGGYTGALPTGAVAGVVHGDEHVIRSASRRRIESQHPGLLDHMNRTGTVPGYRRGGYVNPLPRGSYSVSQPFHAGHNGIDLAAPTGTRIMAAQDGTVSHAGWWPHGGGNQVNMVHPDGVHTWYAHMSRIQTRVGAEMKRGQVIGRVGSTGNSTGPHLHYMVMPGGYPNYINPSPYMTGFTSPEGDGWNPLAGLVDWVSDKITDAFPDAGMFVDAALGAAKHMAEKAVEQFTPSWGTDDTGSTKALLYDNGGWLQPGRHLVENRTGRPEPILTGSQWSSLLESRSERREPSVFNLFDADGQLIGRMRGEAQSVVAGEASRAGRGFKGMY